MEERNPEEMAEKPSVKIGLFTDSHFAEKSRWRDRFYRQSKRKLRTCIDRFNDLEVDFVVNLGDLIDAADSKQEELENLEMIVREFGRFRGPRHSVLGNHCLHSLRKREFLERVGEIGRAACRERV